MPKQVVTSIRVDETLWKEAKIYAIKKGITLAELLNELLKQELEKEASLSK
jgi:predicted DNA-binding ribbon-helix-helix protein